MSNDNSLFDSDKLNAVIERHRKRNAVADLVSRMFFYGDMKIETANERTICGLLNDLGLFPTTEDHICKREKWDDYIEKYKDYQLPSNEKS